MRVENVSITYFYDVFLMVTEYPLLGRKGQNLAKMDIIALAFFIGSTALVSWVTVRREQGGGVSVENVLVTNLYDVFFMVAEYPLLGRKGRNLWRLAVTILAF
ncbi:hypothetical protein [Pseudoalteromonas ardens]|uniref:Uncharacterized protein n=1 Tax=Pseudoalteromonas rubra TaxID=43658 RepID=A0A0L0EWF2_9GAMM|nr:hypothetical protein [Pseudoalteromonas sp. R96]KNC68767.1 hypothetical protein AC626_02845 [Pseudoalteromonas rubra]MDK1310053.1 hypothetical protein [Pseudoalteromonas sp. R96]